MPQTKEATKQKTEKKTFVLRTTSTLILWGIIIASLISKNAYMLTAVFGFFLLIATLEYCKLFQKTFTKVYKFAFIFYILAYGAFLIFTLLKCYKNGTDLPASFFTHFYDNISLAVAFIYLSVFLIFDKESSHDVLLKKFLIALLGFIYLGLLFSFIIKIPFAIKYPQKFSTGLINLLYLILITKITDTGAYLCGVGFGKHKAVPKISSAKTWEGFAGGIVIAIIFSYIFSLIFKKHGFAFNNYELFFVALAIATFAIIGDLFESVLKRSQEIKDSGSVLPGIGGILDLIDSLCFTAPLFYFYLLMFH